MCSNPEANTRFLYFLAASLRAVHRHGGLMRASVASAANDHRFFPPLPTSSPLSLLIPLVACSLFLYYYFFILFSVSLRPEKKNQKFFLGCTLVDRSITIASPRREKLALLSLKSMQPHSAFCLMQLNPAVLVRVCSLGRCKALSLLLFFLTELFYNVL